VGIRRLVRSFRRNLDEDAVHDELRLHIDLETEELVKTGLTPEDARRRALIAFGGVERVREETRSIRRSAALEDCVRDVRHSVRALVGRPVFALVVLAVIAVGTAGIIAVFTLVNRILLRPLPFAQSDRLVVIKHRMAGLEADDAGISLGLYAHYREHATSFSSLSLYDERVLNLHLPDARTQRINVVNTGASFFQMLGAKPALGRLFTEDDGQQGFRNTAWRIPVLLSYDCWIGQFGGDRNVIGRLLMINDRPREVVGVLEKGFAFPSAQTQVWMLWEPSRTTTSSIARNMGYNAVARLQPDVSVADAEAELARLLPRTVGIFEDATPERLAQLRLRVQVVPLKDAVVRDVATMLWPLFGAMGFLLFIAGANAAALFVIRAEDRRRETALRLALGASPRHVARLFVIEALILTLAGTAIGLAVAQALLDGTLASATVQLPRQGEVRLDAAAVIFAAGVAVIMALAYGLLSLRSQRRVLRANLGDGPRATGSAGSRFGVREPLIALQVALALTLMTGSALMLATYRNLSRIDLGFSPDGVVAIDVGLPSSKARLHARIFQDVVEKARQIRGVEHASVASFAPLTSSEHLFPVRAQTTIQRGSAPVPFKFFLPGYFETVRSPIVAGAGFGRDAPVTTPFPVLISAALARRLFPGERAVGKSLERLNANGTPVDMPSGIVRPFTIVGVVGDVRETSLREGPSEVVYVPVLDEPVEQSITPLHMTVLLRTSAATPALIEAIKRTLQAVDPGLSVGTPRSLNSIVETARARERFVGMTLLLASAVSLFLGVVGIYGSVAHRVGSRTREIGIRIALGARRMDVVWMVVSGSMWGVTAGAAFGVAMAVVTARALGSLLFGVQAADPLIFTAVTAVLLGAAAAAAFLAGRGAARVAPAIALRAD
jgi:putative ABC transport system permease protein